MSLPSDQGPQKQHSCREILQHILDGDATPEQQESFKAHMEECLPCYKGYELEMAIKALLKTRCSGNGAPGELIERIKNQIQKNPTR
jgi:anti-sigma factor (TIGR02949 family)